MCVVAMAHHPFFLIGEIMSKWGNVQFYHINNNWLNGEGRYTVAVEVPNTELLLKLCRREIENIEIKIATSKVHPKDNYVKDLGREVSFSRLNNFLSFELKKPIIIFDKQIDSNLQERSKNYTLTIQCIKKYRLTFKVPKDPNKKAYFIHADLL